MAQMGRPSLYTDELADRICKLISTGQYSLRSVAKEIGVDVSTIIAWRLDREDFGIRYARARKIGAEAEFEDIKDDAAEIPPCNSFGMIDTGWVTWKKNQIDAKKWVLMRKNPKDFGDKQAIEITDGSLAERVQKAREKAANDTD